MPLKEPGSGFHRHLLGLLADFETAIQNRGFGHVQVDARNFGRLEARSREADLVATRRDQRELVDSVRTGSRRSCLIGVAVSKQLPLRSAPRRRWRP